MLFIEINPDTVPQNCETEFRLKDKTYLSILGTILNLVFEDGGLTKSTSDFVLGYTRCFTKDCCMLDERIFRHRV